MKKNILLLFGGKSSEHEISIISAKNVFRGIDQSKYHIISVLISRKGLWYQVSRQFLENIPENPHEISYCLEDFIPVALCPAGKKTELVDFHLKNIARIDTVFPVLHGTFGEDGAIQGLLDSWGLPYVGNNLQTSAICMDKDITKRLLIDSGLPVVPYKVVKYGQPCVINFDELLNEFQCSSVFIKPARQGSSVGIYKVKSKKEFDENIQKAFQYDSKLLIEQGFDRPREIEFSFLSYQQERIISQPGEIVPSHDFYDYEAKYVDTQGAKIILPAKIDQNSLSRYQSIIRKAADVLELRDLARIDAFLTKDDKFFINEINTLPGFTHISMYPKLLNLQGIEYSEIIEYLISESLKRNK